MALSRSVTLTPRLEAKDWKALQMVEREGAHKGGGLAGHRGSWGCCKVYMCCGGRGSRRGTVRCKVCAA